MRTHTIRNKAKHTPIVSMTKPFLAMLLSARPESVSLVIASFVKSYKHLTNKTPRLDYDQEQLLLQRAGADANGVWPSKYSDISADMHLVHQCFVNGFVDNMTVRDGLEVRLAVAEKYYDMVDSLLLK